MRIICRDEERSRHVDNGIDILNGFVEGSLLLIKLSQFLRFRTQDH